MNELAELTGTTVRTVRYYHQIGLLPVPALREGRRHYELTHVARLIRIRRLVQAGVPLAQIMGMLRPAADPGPESQADRASVLIDLYATAAALDEQLEQVRGRQAQVLRLIAAAERGDHLSPLPPAIARFYDNAERQSADERTRRAVRRERDFMELLFYRGEMPPEVELAYKGYDEARMTASITLYSQFANRYESSQPPGEEEIARIAAAVVARLTRHLGPDLPRLARAVDLDTVRQAADLYVGLAEKKHRRLDRAITEALLLALEEARNR